MIAGLASRQDKADQVVVRYLGRADSLHVLPDIHPLADAAFVVVNENQGTRGQHRRGSTQFIEMMQGRWVRIAPVDIVRIQVEQINPGNRGAKVMQRLNGIIADEGSAGAVLASDFAVAPLDIDANELRFRTNGECVKKNRAAAVTDPVKISISHASGLHQHQGSVADGAFSQMSKQGRKTFGPNPKPRKEIRLCGKARLRSILLHEGE